MQGSEAPDEIDRVYADNCAVGKTGGDGVEGVPVVGVVEGGNQDESVGDIEVGVAGRQTLAGKGDRCRHRQGDDFEAVPIQVSRSSQAFEVLCQG